MICQAYNVSPSAVSIGKGVTWFPFVVVCINEGPYVRLDEGQDLLANPHCSGLSISCQNKVFIL